MSASVASAKLANAKLFLQMRASITHLPGEEKLRRN
jgi:hypothetical protein